MKWFWILLIIVSALLFLYIFYITFMAFYLVHYVAYPKRKNRNDAYKEDIEYLNSIDNLKREPITFTMSDSYIINGDISLNGNSNKFIILCHGFSWNREGMLKYAQIFYKLGYSILLYDHRSHGDNIHNDVTMGYKEKEDLHEIILSLYNKYGNDIEISLFGESMGAATVLLELEYNDKISFAVCDCPYCDLNELFEYKCKQLFLPKCILKLSTKINKKYHGYKFKDISPLNSSKDSKVPLLLITGNKDDFIPKEHSQKIYNAKKFGYKEIHYFNGAKHARSYKKDPVLYEQLVINFINRIYEK